MNNPISPEIFSDRLIDRLSYAHDASLYRVVPEAVARPRNESDIISLLKHCNNSQTPVTFRTAGTSLSGQAVGPGIIAETVRDWKQWKILDGGNAKRLESLVAMPTFICQTFTERSARILHPLIPA